MMKPTGLIFGVSGLCFWAGLLASCEGAQANDPVASVEQSVLAENTTSTGMAVRNIAQLRTITGAALPSSSSCNDGTGSNANCCILVAGYVDHADGAGGTFCYKPNHPAVADNGGTIVKPTSVPPASTGRWVRDTGGASLNVRWFGAKGDGTTDDTTTVQTAIDSLGSNGGTVLFPAGYTFVFAGTLNLDQKRGYHLVGTSTNMYENGTKLKYTGSGASFINVRSADGVEFRNLFIEYTNAAFTGNVINSDWAPGVSADSMYLTIDGCAISGLPPATHAHSLVRLNSTIISSIRNTHFMYGDYGIIGRDPSYSISIQIRDSAFNYQNISAIRNADENWLIEGCTFEPLADGTAGAYTHDTSLNFWAHGMSWIGNWFGDANGAGTWIKVRALAFNFTGNRMATSGSVGIQFYGGTQGANISGNRIEGSNVTPIVFDPYSPAYGYHYAVSITGNDFCTGQAMAGTGNIVEATILGNNGCSVAEPAIIRGPGVTVSGYVRPGPPGDSQLGLGTLEATLPTNTAESFVGPANGSGDRIDQSLVLQSRSDIPQGEIHLMTGAPPTERIRVNYAGLTIGHGTAISRHLSATASWDPPAIASGNTTGTTVGVANAALGDTIAVGFTQPVPQGAVLGGSVTSAGTVTVTLINLTGAPLDLPAGSIRADVWQHL